LRASASSTTGAAGRRAARGEVRTYADPRDCRQRQLLVRLDESTRRAAGALTTVMFDGQGYATLELLELLELLESEESPLRVPASARRGTHSFDPASE
jgi:hypothetical protein